MVARPTTVAAWLGEPAQGFWHRSRNDPTRIRFDTQGLQAGRLRAPLEALRHWHFLRPPNPSATTPQLRVEAAFRDCSSATGSNGVADRNRHNLKVSAGCGVVAAAYSPSRKDKPVISTNRLPSLVRRLLAAPEASSIWVCPSQAYLTPARRGGYERRRAPRNIVRHLRAWQARRAAGTVPLARRPRCKCRLLDSELPSLGS